MVSEEKRKQIALMLEHERLNFFALENDNDEHLKHIISISFPGYPSNLSFKNYEVFKAKFKGSEHQTPILDFSILTPLSLNYFEDLLKSFYFEDKQSKRINFDKKSNLFFAKVNPKAFSNPYGLFSFEDFMDIRFKKLKIKNGGPDYGKNELTRSQLESGEKNFKNFFFI